MCHHHATTLACAGANVNQVVCATDGVFVVLDHHQGVAFAAKRMQGIEQHLVVARVQTNGGLIQHVTNTLQVATQLPRQTNALRFTAAQGGRTTV